MILKQRIKSKHATNEFLRTVLIDLAKDDSPADIYDADFSKVEVVPHEVYLEALDADLSFTATIGFDRQEPYTDYETYTENVPYTAYENGKAVTRTRREQRQRMVTKYKTVTDWSLHQGKHSAHSLAAVENSDNPDVRANFRSGEFLSAWKDTGDNDGEWLEGQEIEAVEKVVSDDANSMHLFHFRQSLGAAMPGDRHKDIEYEIDEVTKVNSWILCAEEYQMSIKYQGKTYERHAFPFGQFNIAGNTIKGGADEVTKKTWTLGKGAFIRDMFVMLASLAAVLLVHRYIVLIAGGILGLGACIHFIKKSLEIEKNFRVAYKAQKIESLNKKLKSLGLEPVEPDSL